MTLSSARTIPQHLNMPAPLTNILLDWLRKFLKIYKFDRHPRERGVINKETGNARSCAGCKSSAKYN